MSSVSPPNLKFLAQKLMAWHWFPWWHIYMWCPWCTASFFVSAHTKKTAPSPLSALKSEQNTDLFFLYCSVVVLVNLEYLFPPSPSRWKWIFVFFCVGLVFANHCHHVSTRHLYSLRMFIQVMCTQQVQLHAAQHTHTTQDFWHFHSPKWFVFACCTLKKIIFCFARRENFEKRMETRNVRM